MLLILLYAKSIPNPLLASILSMGKWIPLYSLYGESDTFGRS